MIKISSMYKFVMFFLVCQCNSSTQEYIQAH